MSKTTKTNSILELIFIEHYYEKFLKILLLLFFVSVNAEEYISNFQGKRTTLDVHNYSDKDNFRMIKLDGTFTDRLGNYGNWTAMVYVEIKNNQIYNHGFSNHFVYQDESFTFSKGNRTNDEYKQGLVSLLLYKLQII